MKLFRGRHTRAIGIHILLEEIGKPCDPQTIDVAGGGAGEDRNRSAASAAG